MTDRDPRELMTTAQGHASDSANEPAPEPGSRFGGYLLMEVIGQGGMGIVYKARQEAVDRLVALKIMRNRQSGPEEVQRFTNEARAIARLVHPGIVRIHDVGQVGTWHYLACELIHGTGLDQIIAGQPMAPDRALEIAALLAEAVDYAHQRGVIHRDLKPSNVLIDAKGAPHLTDFGLACRIDVESPRLTRTGEVVGTPAYMSPEQASEEFGPIAGTTDVHGLGTILYDMQTGRPPFRGETLLKTLHQVLYQLPIAPDELCPDVPPSHAKLCLKCLAKNPADRHPSARAVAIHCRGLLAGLVPSPPPTATVQPAPDPVQPGEPGSTAPPAPLPAAPSALRPLLMLACLITAGIVTHLLRTHREDRPAATAPVKSQAPAPPDLIPRFIQAIEREDRTGAFEVLGRHLALHPDDWPMRSKRIDLARELDRTIEVVQDLQALDAAGKLSDLETQMLMEMYLNLKQHKRASELIQRVTRRNPTLASLLALEQVRQHLADGKPIAAARAWLRAPSGKTPDVVLLGTLTREFRNRLSDRSRQLPADLPRLLRELTRRDKRFFDWPSTADWFAADPRRVEQLSFQLLEKLLAQSCRDRKWDAVGRAAGRTLMTRHPARAKQVLNEAGRQTTRAFKAGRYQDALQHLNRILALQPRYAGAFSDRSACYVKLGNEERALADCTEALRLEPGQPDWQWWRGWLQSGRAQYTQAIRDFTAALADDRGTKSMRHKAHIGRGYAYLLSKQPAKAREDFERLSPRHSCSKCDLGLALTDTATGETETAAARATLREILDSNRPLFDAPSFRAHIKVATLMTALLPRHPLSHAERGLVHFRLGNRSEAIRDFERAVALSTGEYARHGSPTKQALAKARALPKKNKR